MIPDTTMQDAFAVLADELDAQAEAMAQEMRDLWDVWQWTKQYGGSLSEIGVLLYSPTTIPTRIDIVHNGKGWLRAAAEWVRKQSDHE